MATVDRKAPAVIGPRYFGTTRILMLLRLDDGSLDKFDPNDIRDEVDPSVGLSARLGTRSFGSLGLAPIDLPLTRTDPATREVITDSAVNLEAAIARAETNGDGLTRRLDVQPISYTRSVGSYRAAGQIDIELDWRACPFDARMIRAILVLCYEGTVPAEGWASGERSRYLVPATGENLRFVGVIDEVADRHSGDGDTISMRGRDLTATLIDTDFAPKADIQLEAGSTIASAVRKILDTDPKFQIIRGPFLRTESDLPVLSQKLYPRLAVSAKERNRQAKSGGQAFMLRRAVKGEKTTYWDVITDLCVSHGLRPMIELDRLWLVEPRTLYRRNEVFQTGISTFPSEYRIGLGDRTPIRRMVFGRNISSLNFDRKLARIKAPAVEVTARNPDAADPKDRLISVRWPKRVNRNVEKTNKSTQPNSVDATGKKAEVKVHPVQISGIVDQSILLSIAKQTYEGMGRQELGITIETEALASWSDAEGFDPNRDPDLLALRFGDPIRLLVADDSGRIALYTLSELQRMVARITNRASGSGGASAFRSAVAFLRARGWTEDDARQFARVLASANLPQEFRVVGMTVRFSRETGFSIGIEARDYVRVRADPESATRAGGVDRPVPGSGSTR